LLQSKQALLRLLLSREVKQMWIISQPKTYLVTFLVGLLLGFGLGVHATHGAEYINVVHGGLTDLGTVAGRDSDADLFLTPNNVDGFASVLVLGDEFAAFNVEQGIANIPEPPTFWLVLAVGEVAIALAALVVVCAILSPARADVLCNAKKTVCVGERGVYGPADCFADMAKRGYDANEARWCGELAIPRQPGEPQCGEKGRVCE
jgi:hypothetical protein